MRQRIPRGIALWAGILALLCQILLPFGLAWMAGAAAAEASLQTSAEAHYHDPNLANAFGRDWLFKHSHAGDHPNCRVRIDQGYLPPCAAADPPAEPAAKFRWVAYIAVPTAPAPPAADGFTRPLPRAPPPSA